MLDGNVRRVLCRVYDIAEDPRAPATERLWALAGDLVQAAPEGQPGDLNEALMELGALVCVPGEPDCPGVPAGSPLPGTGTRRPGRATGDRQTCAHAAPRRWRRR